MVLQGCNNVLLVIFISVCAQPITNLDIFRLSYILSLTIG